MTGLVPYLHFDGNARDALTFYAQTFGGYLTLHTFGDFGQEDAPFDGIAHGILDGPVVMFGADISRDQRPIAVEGLMFSLLGTAEPETLESWFVALAEGGTVLDPLQLRPWGAHDGTLVDRFGLTWLIGYEV